MTTTRDLPMYVYPNHGRAGFYFRRKGHTGKLPIANPGTKSTPSPEWHALMAGVANKTLELPVAQVKRGHLDEVEGTVGALAFAYFQDATRFGRLDPKTQGDYRRFVENCLRTTPDGEREDFAFWIVEKVRQQHCEALRRALKRPVVRRIDGNDSTWRDNHMFTMRAMFEWGIKTGHCKHNPFARLETLVNREEEEGWYTWTDDDVAKFKARHPIGTKAHLALMLLLYTVVRRSDLVRLGKPMLRNDGALHFVETKFSTSKTKKKKLKPRRIVMRDALREVIDATPGAWDGETFLKTDKGKAFTGDTLANVFQLWCLQAGLGGDADGRMEVEPRRAPVEYEGKLYQPGQRFRMLVAHTAIRRYLRSLTRFPTYRAGCHGVRKYVATTAAEKGRNAWQIAGLLGHSGIKNVARYTKKVQPAKMFESAMDGLF